MTVGLEFARVLKLPTLRENLSLSKRGANTESMAYKRSRIALSGKGEICIRLGAGPYTRSQGNAPEFSNTTGRIIGDSIRVSSARRHWLGDIGWCLFGSSPRVDHGWRDSQCRIENEVRPRFGKTLWASSRPAHRTRRPPSGCQVPQDTPPIFIAGASCAPLLVGVPDAVDQGIRLLRDGDSIQQIVLAGVFLPIAEHEKRAAPFSRPVEFLGHG